MANYLIKPTNPKSTAVVRICEQCNCIFYSSPSTVKHNGARFCTKECKDVFNRGENSYAWRVKPTRICINCQVEYKINAWRLKNRKRGQFCSQKCQAIYRIGENSANWKNGITKINRRIRSRKEILQWRIAVLERDNYTCIWCGATEDLQVDHIKQFALFPELRAVLSNGRVLCRPCHIKTFTKAVA